MNDTPGPNSVLVYWLPLGADDPSHLVRLSGRAYEAIIAARQKRPRAPLFHSALAVSTGSHRYTIEMAPAWRQPGDHGVVSVGPVGWRPLGRSKLFRYEVRRWRDGVIPDQAAAVESPRVVASDSQRVRILLDQVPLFPTATWGRDELHTGEMWNSNSLTSWLLVRSGHDVSRLAPPAGGRAPGWHAGLVQAARIGSASPTV